MANFISNIAGNVPPKARMILGLTAVVSIGGIIAFTKMYSGEEDAIDNLSGQAVVIVAPSNSDISKKIPGEGIIIPKDSPVAQQIEKSRVEEIEKAKNTGGGFIEQMSFDNNRRILEKETTGNLGAGNVQGFNSLDDELLSRNAINEQRNIEIREQQSRVRKNMNQEQVQRAYENRQENLLQENEFLSGELEKADIGPDYSSYGELINYDPISPAYTSYGQGNISNNLDGDNSGNGYTPPAGSYASGYVNKSDYNTREADLANLNKIRGLTGSKGTVNTTGSGNNNQVSAYRDMVNPMGNYNNTAKEKVNVGEMHYAILEIGVNTDEIGPVRAIIPSEGKLHEAILVGEPVLIGEKASIAFSAMSKDGVDMGVVAIALDPETMRPALADNVDRHIFDRYFKLALAAAADGYVTALTGSSTKTYSDGSSEKIIDRLPDSSDQIAAAIGKVGSVLIPKFENNFDRPPTVEINSNRDIIIMFLQGFEI